MALYHFSAKMVKRSSGRSSVAASAYRSATDMQCERYGVRHNYDRKHGVTHTEIMAPENAPDWMHDREQLWNAVERIEKRKDAQLARDLTLALPHELSADQRRDLVRQFVQEQFVSRGMIADLSIHEPHHEGDTRNHHAHIMLTTRELLADGFGKKNRAWNDTAQLQQWREAWATIQNQHLEALGISSRVDHRSLEAQGIDREPQQHEGPTVTNMKRKGDLQSVVEENAQREAANDNLADLHEELLQTQLEIDEIRSQQSEIVAEAQADIVAEESANRLELELQHGAEIAALDHMQAQTYKPHLETIESQADVLQERIASAGMVRKLFRNFTGITRRDEQRLEQIKATIAATYDRMKQQREELASRHRFELSEAARRERERKEGAAQSVYEADRRAAQEAAERVKLEAGTMTLAQRLALRSEQLQARKDGLEHKTEQSHENRADEGLRLERDP